MLRTPILWEDQMPGSALWRCVGALLAVGVLGVIVIRHEALAQVTPIQITVGDTVTLQLDGNPSTGYSWVLQDAPREYFAFVSVDVLGYAKPALKPGERPVLGAAQKFQVLVTGIDAGHANLVFNYLKAGDPTPARTAEFAIEVLDDGTLERDASDSPRRDLFPNPSDEQDGGGNPIPF
jgi:hypothetical protein